MIYLFILCMLMRTFCVLPEFFANKQRYVKKKGAAWDWIKVVNLR